MFTLHILYFGALEQKRKSRAIILVRSSQKSMLVLLQVYCYGEYVVRYKWNELNTQQVGTYAEYYVKMEMTMHGFQVYSSEVDDRGIDFIARHETGPFLSIQVKSIRAYNYVFMRKSVFPLSPQTLLALVSLWEGEEPELYIIPSLSWEKPDSLFVDRNYEGLKSKPEWGLNLSMQKIHRIERYKFENYVEKIREI